MESEQAFVRSAYRGAIMSMVFVFCAILGATLNVLLAMMAIFCVAFIMVTVLAVMAMKGWNLGVSECLCTVVLIGIAVDYVVLLAMSYMHSGARKRSGKMEEAYREMGTSVMSSMITTAGSSVFMFICKVYTF